MASKRQTSPFEYLFPAVNNLLLQKEKWEPPLTGPISDNCVVSGLSLESPSSAAFCLLQVSYRKLCRDFCVYVFFKLYNSQGDDNGM